MTAFKEIKLNWGGVDYSIPPRSVLGAIARIEEHLTFSELLEYGRRKTIPMSRLSGAFGSLLRYVGINITDEQVYEDMFHGRQGPDAMIDAITVLMEMMIPPSAPKTPVLAIGESEGKPTSGKRKASAGKASKRTSRSR